MIRQILKNDLNDLKSRPLFTIYNGSTHSKCTYVSIVLCFMFVCILVWAPAASASTKVRFKQIIAPLNCLFDEVNDGSGAVVYLTPETCGTVIQPTSRITNTTTSNTATTTSQSPPVPTEYYSGSQYLETEGGSTSTKNGYMLIVRAGLVYSFRLAGDSPVGAPRTIEITSIHDGFVTLTFGPGDRQAKLREGQSIKANIAYDSGVDVEVTVVRINEDSSAILHVKFPVQSRLAGNVSQTNNTAVAIAVLWILVGAALYVHAHARYRNRHTRYYDRNWKVDEIIK